MKPILDTEVSLAVTRELLV
uniref:Uncharacterized protein n=1 Tax=Anguilla anguilla TaxID=7936 RepID=A0A0E9PK35_ANGAN